MIKIIYDTDYMDMDLGFAYRFLNNESLLTEAHAHNYFEYFLITSGSINHFVNGREDVLEPGALVFIRPSDFHQYHLKKDSDCELINISFTSANFESACKYLGEDIKQYFLEPTFPPYIKLSHSQTVSLAKDHDFLNFYTGNTETLLIRLKFLLMEILSNFIKTPPAVSVTSGFKEWFDSILNRMNTQENIEEGIPALLRLTGFSHGHLCRVMKEYYNMTPIQYITNLRMLYASNLLLNSDLDILTISMRVGYTSLSHFITTFKKQFSVSPSKFRQQNTRIKAWK